MNSPLTVLRLLIAGWAAVATFYLLGYVLAAARSWRAWRATPRRDASFNHHATQALACVTPDRAPLRVVGGTDQ